MKIFQGIKSKYYNLILLKFFLLSTVPIVPTHPQKCLSYKCDVEDDKNSNNEQKSVLQIRRYFWGGNVLFFSSLHNFLCPLCDDIACSFLIFTICLFSSMDDIQEKQCSSTENMQMTTEMRPYISAQVLSSLSQKKDTNFQCLSDKVDLLFVT